MRCDLIEKSLRDYPNQLAVCGAQSITYGQLAEKTARPPETGVFVARNTVQDIVTIVRCLRHGVTAAPVRDADVMAQLGVARFDDIATILATSGSSDAPRFIAHSLDNHYYSALGSRAMIPLGSGDRWLLSLPLHHISGSAIVMRCLFAGATIVVPGDKSLSQCITNGAATHVSVVPAQLARATPAWRQLKAVLVGGQHCGEKLRRRVWQLGIAASYSYGSTETASHVTATDPTELDLSSGTVLPHRELTIADGEILVSGNTVAVGTVADGRLVPRHGPLATGDLGVMENGKLNVIGRKDNMFISGGENIFPERIESVLLDAPGVEQVVVVPKKDEKWGQRPVAFVAGDVSLANVLAFARERLPRFMVPDQVLSLPAVAGIKPRRAKLIARANTTAS